MKESVFQYELKKSIEDEGGLCYKFSDGIRAKGIRFIPKKPADFIAVVRKDPILIECKQLKTIKQIKYTFFGNNKEVKQKMHWTEYHQVKELLKFYKKGNDAYYAINIRITGLANILILLHIEMFMSNYMASDYITKDKLLVLMKNGITGYKYRYSGITKKL